LNKDISELAYVKLAILGAYGQILIYKNIELTDKQNNELDTLSDKLISDIIPSNATSADEVFQLINERISSVDNWFYAYKAQGE